MQRTWRRARAPSAEGAHSHQSRRTARASLGPTESVATFAKRKGHETREQGGTEPWPPGKDRRSRTQQRARAREAPAMGTQVRRQPNAARFRRCSLGTRGLRTICRAHLRGRSPHMRWQPPRTCQWPRALSFCQGDTCATVPAGGTRPEERVLSTPTHGTRPGPQRAAPWPACGAVRPAPAGRARATLQAQLSVRPPYVARASGWPQPQYRVRIFGIEVG